MTDRLRAEVVEAYQAGQTSRQMAEESGLGRSTVLGILRDAGETVPPQGQKY
ncbi:helix-turn-helix domain-containing protein [Mycolicibacterium cosmeticum]|uniref:helix-turn-helix domain-containing protein n=1 Tax=Mycolicibacterium cosmeticum TaxID=258533 RepID=UPI003204C791